jgi:hypothetical protein
MEILNDLFAFLGVAKVGTDFPIDRKNQSGIAKNPFLRGIWTGTALVRAKFRNHLPKSLRDSVGRLFLGSMQKQAFPEHLRARLINYYAKDIVELEAITRKCLDSWRTPPPISR